MGKGEKEHAAGDKETGGKYVLHIQIDLLFEFDQKYKNFLRIFAKFYCKIIKIVLLVGEGVVGTAVP